MIEISKKNLANLRKFRYTEHIKGKGGAFNAKSTSLLF